MNTKHLLIFLVGSLLLTACNRRENNEPELEQKQDEVKVDDETRKRKEPKTEADLEKYGAEFPFFFGGIIVPDRMEVHQALSMRDLKTMVLLVEIYGEAYAQMSSSTHDKFVTLARQIRDVEQKKGEGYRHIPGTSAETINSGINPELSLEKQNLMTILG